MCWYLRYGLSYRDVDELLAERGIVVDHLTIYRLMQTFTSEFFGAAGPSQHTRGDRWLVDGTSSGSPIAGLLSAEPSIRTAR